VTSYFHLDLAIAQSEVWSQGLAETKVNLNLWRSAMLATQRVLASLASPVPIDEATALMDSSIREYISLC